MQQVTFESTDLSIHGTLTLPQAGNRPFPGVVIFHGMTSSENSYIPLTTKLAEQGIAGLAISMRGHGGSEGDFHEATVAEAIDDAVAAYDFIASQEGVDPDNIGVVGSSVGSILAAMATEQRAVKSVALRAPAAYTDQMMKLSMAGTMVNEGRQFHEIQDLGNTPAGNAIAKFTGSLLVVASENDALIPPEITEGYLDLATHSNKKQLIVIEGAPHQLTGTQWKDTFDDLAVDWFKGTLLHK